MDIDSWTWETPKIQYKGEKKNLYSRFTYLSISGTFCCIVMWEYSRNILGRLYLPLLWTHLTRTYFYPAFFTCERHTPGNVLTQFSGIGHVWTLRFGEPWEKNKKFIGCSCCYLEICNSSVVFVKETEQHQHGARCKAIPHHKGAEYTRHGENDL